VPQNEANESASSKVSAIIPGLHTGEVA
jgi:hypothetical protein